MAEATQAWLKTNVGEPSGKWGSKYSEIYKKTGEFQNSTGKAKSDKLDTLLTLIGEHSYSKHKAAASDSERAEKDRQQRFLNEFAEELKVQRLALNPGALVALRAQMAKSARNYPREKQIVIDVLEEMKASANPLLANTGKGIDQDKIVMVLSDTVAGAFNVNGVMQINPLRTRNKTLLMALLVHEYHHKLCKHNGAYAYADEFVAHWKEYSITKPAAASEEARANEINRQLLLLYPSQVNSWLSMNFEMFESIAQAGDFLVPDNAAAKPSHISRHTAGRLAATRARAGAVTSRPPA